MRRNESFDDCPICRHLKEEMAELPFTPLEELEKRGVSMPEPATLDDGLLHATLWRVIDELARRQIYLDCTDHLSDRELYERLWSDVLRTELCVGEGEPALAVQFCLVAGGSRGDLTAFLTYYASDEARQRVGRELLGFVPQHIEPQYQRDELLPTPLSGEVH